MKKLLLSFALFLVFPAFAAASAPIQTNIDSGNNKGIRFDYDDSVINPGVNNGQDQTVQWTAPSNVTSVNLQLWGAGGGSYITQQAGGNGRVGSFVSGGGGGGALRTASFNVVPGTTYTITVGHRGYGPTSGNPAGTAGSASSFSDQSNTLFISAPGGGLGHNNFQQSNTLFGGSGGGQSDQGSAVGTFLTNQLFNGGNGGNVTPPYISTDGVADSGGGGGGSGGGGNGGSALSSGTTCGTLGSGTPGLAGQSGNGSAGGGNGADIQCGSNYNPGDSRVYIQPINGATPGGGGAGGGWGGAGRVVLTWTPGNSFDFSISAANATLVASRVNNVIGSGTNTINVGLVKGTSQPVTLSVTKILNSSGVNMAGFLSNISSFSKSQVTPTDSSVLTMFAAAPVGTYTVEVTGTAGSITHTTSFTFTETTDRPQYYPPNNVNATPGACADTSSDGKSSVLVSWQAPQADLAPVTGYLITVDDGYGAYTDPSSPKRTFTVDADQRSFTVTGLLPQTLHTVDVTAIYSSVNSNHSPATGYYVMAPGNCLTGGCIVAPNNHPDVNTPVQWGAQPIGGQQPYFYSWYGTGYTSPGNVSSISRTFTTTGPQDPPNLVISDSGSGLNGRTVFPACPSINVSRGNVAWVEVKVNYKGHSDPIDHLQPNQAITIRWTAENVVPGSCVRTGGWQTLPSWVQYFVADDGLSGAAYTSAIYTPSIPPVAGPSRTPYGVTCQSSVDGSPVSDQVYQLVDPSPPAVSLTYRQQRYPYSPGYTLVNSTANSYLAWTTTNVLPGSCTAVTTPDTIDLWKNGSAQDDNYTRSNTTLAGARPTFPQLQTPVTYKLGLQCRGLYNNDTFTPGGTSSYNTSIDYAFVTVPAAPPVPTVDLKYNNSDGPVTLSYPTVAGKLTWTSSNLYTGIATPCTGSYDSTDPGYWPSNWSSGLPATNSSGFGTMVAPPPGVTAVYTITCQGLASISATDSVTVTASGVPSIDLGAAVGATQVKLMGQKGGTISITSGQAVTPVWYSTALDDVGNQFRCATSNGTGSWPRSSVPTTNSKDTDIKPTSTATYQIQCTNQLGTTVSDSMTIEVRPPPSFKEF